MSYDRNRIRGRHPRACTCVECQERQEWSLPKRPGFQSRLATPEEAERLKAAEERNRRARYGNKNALQLSGKDGSAWGCLIVLVLAALIAGAVLFFVVDPFSDDSQQTTEAQAEEDRNWLGINCGEPRKRRRGGWVRALTC